MGHLFGHTSPRTNFILNFFHIAMPPPVCTKFYIICTNSTLVPVFTLTFILSPRFFHTPLPKFLSYSARPAGRASLFSAVSRGTPLTPSLFPRQLFTHLGALLTPSPNRPVVPLRSVPGVHPRPQTPFRHGPARPAAPPLLIYYIILYIYI